jgi:glycosyltransferase involved in cell wall biosynthesis
VRVLCVDNGPIVAKGTARLLNQHSARFHVELATRLGGLTLTQALVDWGGTESLADFDLTSCPMLRIEALPWREERPLTRVASYLRALPRILSLTRRAEHLYVFLPGNLPTLFLAAARLLGRPYGVYVRGEIDPRNPLMRAALRGARFAFHTEGLGDRIRPWCPATETVTPMIEMSLDDLGVPREPRRDPPWRLLFVGRVQREKGIDDLIDAAKLLVERGCKLSVSVVGGPGGVGDEPERLRRKIRDLGLEGVVVLHGMVSQRTRLAEFYREADLFVLPTFYPEGFPRVLYEAMSYGVPALTTFVGGIPSLMVDGENCLRIEVEDPEQLAGTIERALRAPELRLRISAGGVATMRRLLGERRKTHAEQVVERLAQ